METFFNIYCIVLAIIITIALSLVGGEAVMMEDIIWMRIFGASFVVSAFVYVIRLMCSVFV